MDQRLLAGDDRLPDRNVNSWRQQPLQAREEYLMKRENEDIYIIKSK